MASCPGYASNSNTTSGIPLYSRPPIVQPATISTNPAANTLQTDIVVAAPGVNFRLRIVGLSVSLRQNEPAANVFQLRWNVAGGAAWQNNLQVGANGADTIIFAEPGLVCGANADFTVTSRCTAAARAFDCSVHYFIDPI